MHVAQLPKVDDLQLYQQLSCHYELEPHACCYMPPACILHALQPERIYLHHDTYNSCRLCGLEACCHAHMQALNQQVLNMDTCTPPHIHTP